MNLAVSNWNATITPVDIQKISGGNVITAGASASNLYGWYTRYATSFTIHLNSTKINATCTNVSNCITSVFVHEFGHTFYQGDDPPVCSTCSVMRGDRPRSSTTMKAPRTYDINVALGLMSGCAAPSPSVVTYEGDYPSYASLEQLCRESQLVVLATAISDEVREVDLSLPPGDSLEAGNRAIPPSTVSIKDGFCS